MSDDISEGRRRFLGAAAMTVAAAEFGLIGSGLPTLRIATDGASELGSLSRATGWLNSPPLMPENLRGKVIVVDFCTYTCINWLRSLPYVRAWAAAYKDSGLVLVGAHTPEFSFEKNVENVRRAVKEMGIEYPIAIDNDYAIWNGFANHYWPALYLVDASGRVRYRHFGEGQYDQSERMIRDLLTEAGADVDRVRSSVEPRWVEQAADWDDLQSPESYLGYDRGRNFASPGGAVLAKDRLYDAPARLRLNQWSLAGNWTIQREATVANQVNGRIAFRFHARDLHLIMGPAAQGHSVPFRVLIDGRSPGGAHGSDIDEGGSGMVAEQRMYQLIRQSKPIADRDFEIAFLDPGAEAFCFTFG